MPKPKAERYLELMNEVALPDYRAVEGNLGAWRLSRDLGDLVEVRMLTFWRDMEAIRAFAGADVARAKYYDFDAEFLAGLPEAVDHFDMTSG